MMKTIALLLLSASWVFGADWYLDNAASGANNGTRTDAWNSTASINWTSISPGDTLWVSGGTTSKTYTGTWSIPVSGTAGNYITIAKGRDTGHDGEVIWDGKIEMSGDYIVLDGRHDASFDYSEIRPFNIEEIKANVGWKVGDPDATTSAVKWTGQVGWHVYGMETTNAGTNDVSAAKIHGIESNTGVSPYDLSDVEIKYNWSHHNKMDGINLATNKNPNMDDILIERNLVEYNGDDQIQSTNGVTMCWNFAGRLPVVRYGHPDTIQTAGQEIRIYNNVLVAASNSFIFHESTAVATDNGHVYIYGNVCYVDGDDPPYGVSLGQQWSAGQESTAAYEGLIFVHNTVANSNGAAFETSADTGDVTDTTLTKCVVANNIGYNVGTTTGSKVFDIGGTQQTIATDADAIMDYNISGTFSTVLMYDNVVYDDAADLAASTAHDSNIDGAPTFADAANDDYRLSASDTTARDAGAVLSTLIDSTILARMTGIGTDIYGNLRDAGGTPDIGAIEYASAPAPSSNGRAFADRVIIGP